MVQQCWKTVKWHFTKLNKPFAYNPAAFLGIYLKDLKTEVHTKTCTQIFTAILTIIAKPWNLPKCSLITEWMIKKNKTVVHPCNRMLLTYCAKIKP